MNAPVSTTLPNGLRVLVQENHAAKVVAIQVWVRVGSADEVGPEAGLAHVHEHMLFKGTARRKVGEIAAEVEGAGGDINAWTSFDQTVYHVTMASRDFDVGLDILADAVQHSAFDPEELTKELEVVLEELRRGNDTPSRVASENLFNTAYQAHPYRRPIIGYVDTVKAFTRPMITDFYARWYRPRNMCLVVVGDVRAEDVIARAGQLFGQDEGAPLPPRARPTEPAQTELRTIRATQDIQETHLGLAWHGPPLVHEDTGALDVLSILLGSGDSSRLFRAVRRERELVNDVYAYAYTPEDPGLIMLGATIHGDTVEDAYRAILEELWKLRREGPTQAEVDKAKTIILAEAVYAKETVQGMARKLGYYALSVGDPAYEEVYYAHVRRTTPEDVLRVARKYFTKDGLTVSALLPTAQAAQLSEEAMRRIAAEVDAAHPLDPTITAVAEPTTRVTLKNGATLVVHPDRSVPLVSVRAAGKGGLLAEDASNNGVSHLVGQLLTQGTKRFSAEHIAERSDATAASLGGISGRNSLGIRGDFLREFWDEGFELFTSCLLEPTFDERELERERKAQLEDVAARQDSLSTVAMDRLAQALWKGHPYRYPTVGTTESVSRLDVAAVRKAYELQLRPDKLSVVVVGDVDVADTVARFERTIGQAAGRGPVFQLPAPERWPEVAQTTQIARPKEQAHFVLGFPGIDQFDERRPALEVLNSILGGQGGRLFLELRDKLSLCYSVSSFSVEGLAPGYFAVYMGTSQDKLETAEAGIKKELDKVVAEEVSAEELARAKRYLIGAHEIGLQRISARANSMVYSELYGLGWDEHTRYAGRVEAVTAKRVRDVARDLVRYDRAVRSLVEVGK